MQTITLKPLFHRGKENIAIVFSNSGAINNLIKRISEVRWSQTHRCWYTPLSETHYRRIVDQVKAIAFIDARLLADYLEQHRQVQASGPPVTNDEPQFHGKGASGRQPLSPPPAGSPLWLLCGENLRALEQLVQHLKLKAYSASTIRTYRSEFLQLLRVLKGKPVYELTSEELKRYLVYAMERLGVSENTAHSRLNALKFYFEQVLGREKFFMEIPRPKKQLQLPRFFSQDEIAAIINAAGNLKHKVMLMLAYSAGLRVSEVVRLKTCNIDSGRMCILIERAKGKKDRMVRLSPLLLVMLREYWKAYQPARDGFLFEGQAKGCGYSCRSLQLVLAAAKQKAGIMKPGSVHALRHSFATHLLDKGTDVTMIMKLLGHNDIKTTLRYLHVTNRDMLQVVSPLDELDLKL
jgi:integrase/recombinase XerD